MKRLILTLILWLRIGAPPAFADPAGVPNDGVGNGDLRRQRQCKARPHQRRYWASAFRSFALGRCVSLGARLLRYLDLARSDGIVPKLKNRAMNYTEYSPA